MLFPLGPSANAMAIIVGSCIGVAIGSRLPETMRKTVFHCLALSTIIIGLQMALKTQEPIILIFSLLIGGILGELLKIEEHINTFGNFIKSKIKSKNPRFTEGFVNSSILFCIGAMGIVASFDEGLRGDISIALSKSALDGVASIAIASAYGFGVVFSGFMVFIYQGLFVVFAEILQPYIGEILLNELTAVGGTLIVGISLNLLEVVQIRLANLMPALLVVVVLISLFT